MHANSVRSNSTWSRIAGSSFMMARPSILVLIAQSPNQIGEMRRHALIDDVVINGAQLLADAGLNLPAESRFGLWGSGSDHVVLASGFSLTGSTGSRLELRCFISSFPRSPMFAPAVDTAHSFPLCANALTWPEVPAPELISELFLRCGVFASNLSTMEGEGRSVHLTSRTPAPAVASPLCPRPHG